EEAYSMNASVDATLVFGAALDAETFSNQYSVGNSTFNEGSSNSATLGSDIATDAAGNIGVNVAAGNGNAQGNQLSIASGDASQATATTSSYQVSMGNNTTNVAWYEETPAELDEGGQPIPGTGGLLFVQGHLNDASIGGNAFAGAAGNIGVNVAAGSGNLQGNALSIAAARAPIGEAP
ncbi:MAG: hypothetical protein DRQ52_12515, partial [Gammaproteobacteria bacterium]